MTLFKKREPDLGDLAAYVVESARGRGISVNHGRLVLLLYLVDAECVARGRAPVTGIAWEQGRRGPTAEGLDERLRALVQREKEASRWGRWTARESFRDGARGDDWVVGTKLAVDGVVRAYAGLDLAELRAQAERAREQEP
jgi:hypothetical protein